MTRETDTEIEIETEIVFRHNYSPELHCGCEKYSEQNTRFRRVHVEQIGPCDDCVRMDGGVLLYYVNFPLKLTRTVLLQEKCV